MNETKETIPSHERPLLCDVQKMLNESPGSQPHIEFAPLPTFDELLSFLQSEKFELEEGVYMRSLIRELPVDSTSKRKTKPKIECVPCGCALGALATFVNPKIWQEGFDLRPRAKNYGNKKSSVIVRLHKELEPEARNKLDGEIDDRDLLQEWSNIVDLMFATVEMKYGPCTAIGIEVGFEDCREWQQRSYSDSPWWNQERYDKAKALGVQLRKFAQEEENRRHEEAEKQLIESMHD